MDENNYSNGRGDAGETPNASEVQTLGGIFLEPGKTFESMKLKPKFLLAGLITIFFLAAFQVAFMVLNLIVLFIKAGDDIDPLAGQKGLIHANPSMFVDGKSMPVLATLLGSIDLFQIWGVVLAAIGLKVMGSLSNVSAWTIVLILWLIGLTAKVLGSLFLGVQV